MKFSSSASQGRETRSCTFWKKISEYNVHQNMEFFYHHIKKICLYYWHALKSKIWKIYHNLSTCLIDIKRTTRLWKRYAIKTCYTHTYKKLKPECSINNLTDTENKRVIIDKLGRSTFTIYWSDFLFKKIYCFINSGKLTQILDW